MWIMEPSNFLPIFADSSPFISMCFINEIDGRTHYAHLRLGDGWPFIWTYIISFHNQSIIFVYSAEISTVHKVFFLLPFEWRFLWEKKAGSIRISNSALNNEEIFEWLIWKGEFSRAWNSKSELIRPSSLVIITTKNRETSPIIWFFLNWNVIC